MAAAFDFDKMDIRRSFARASNSYDSMAKLQRDVGWDLLKLQNLFVVSGTILDLGCGTGFLTRELGQYTDGSNITAIDIAMPMLQVARTRNEAEFICADIENLPIKENSVDWIFSNLALQWCPNLEQVFNNFRRVLKPEGRFLISTFGPRTLHELKSAWARVDGFTHVNHFYNLQELCGFIDLAGLQIETTENDQTQSEYLEVMDLMRELKGIGAHNVNSGRNRAITTKAELKTLISAYEEFRVNGYLPATYDLIFISGKVL